LWKQKKRKEREYDKIKKRGNNLILKLKIEILNYIIDENVTLANA
jgi:hypothetical protein